MKSAQREPLITPAQLAAILQVSRNTALRIMREEGAITVGIQLRWTGTKLERYLRVGGSRCTSEPQSKSDSFSEADPSPFKATTTAANGTQPQRIKPIAGPHLKLLENRTRTSRTSDRPSLAPRANGNPCRRSDRAQAVR